jgi:hypothetical protein
MRIYFSEKNAPYIVRYVSAGMRGYIHLVIVKRIYLN